MMEPTGSDICCLTGMDGVTDAHPGDPGSAGARPEVARGHSPARAADSRKPINFKHRLIISGLRGG